MSYPHILHHGAIAGVTGSCHQLRMDEQHSLLVDCGLFQGAEVSPEGGAGVDNLAIDFSLSGIQALVVTHVHIDHVGRIPYLLAAGFKGPILCSEPSAKLLPIVLEDAFKLGFSRDQQQVERYLELLEQRIIALPYDAWFTLVDTELFKAAIRLQCAGHILGSAYVEIELTYKPSGLGKRVVFSGDLGAPHSPLLPAPKAPERADILVIESTYGDRLHEDRRSRRQRLQHVIEQALANKGTVLIPAFSIGRTQELLYELEDILHEHPGLAGRGHGSAESGAVDWGHLPIILDSPLASRFTQLYRELEPFWDIEALARVREGRKPLSFANLLAVDTHPAHLAMVKRLAETAQPAIVIAAGGMCAGGRIVDYLKAMLHDSRHDVLFVGYQARGTPGHAIQTHGSTGGYVLLDGVRYNIGARIHTIAGYSAHADQQGLLDFVACMDKWPSEIRIVHGDPEAKRALAARYQALYQQENRDVAVEIPEACRL